MKVLILGAKGMLGQELVRVFERGNDVTAWDFEDIDITDGQQVSEKISQLKPDLTINSAAYNNVDKAESEVQKAKDLNWYAVGHVARICKETGSGMVHFSTDNVFDGENKGGYTEEAMPNPISVYGHSKLMGERLLQDVMKDDFWLIRLSRLFGEPASSAAAKLSFVEQLRRKAETQKVISMLDEELSCLTYAPDLAEAVRQIVAHRPSGIYHRTNQGAVTWFGFAQEIVSLLNLDVALQPTTSEGQNRVAKRPKYSILLNTKLPPMRPWQEALAEFLSQQN